MSNISERIIIYNNMKNCRIIIGWQLLLLLLITLLTTTAVEAATGNVDISTVYQELEGFGASNVWSCSTLKDLGNSKPQIYDVIFGDLGLDILRTRNTYGYAGDSANYMARCKEVIADGRARTGRPLKILISSWSPKADLKSNNSESGGGNATLKKSGGQYVYAAYAVWWADSLESWASGTNGLTADYISMQNEPDYDASWDSCRFEPSQTTDIAGYDTAFEAVYSELYSRMRSAMPKMLACETTGLSRAGEYIDELDDLSHVYGYNHHLYNCSDGGEAGCASNPDYYTSAMTSFAALVEYFGYKPILQTEYSDDSYDTTYEACMDLAVLMHNSLVVEGASGYLYWQLTYGTGDGLVSITSTSWTINPIYYAFKHYSAFTDPGWYRVEASTTSSNLRISAYISPDSNQLSVVIINTNASSSVNLDLSFTGFTIDDGDVYQTTSSKNCELVGSYDGTGTLNIPANSITTLHLTGAPGYSNCDEVLADGYGLESDLSGDCYVDYEDLDYISDYWLNTNCGSFANCEGADFEPTDGDVDLFDFSRFAEQWMWCNDPTDPNCTPNW